MIIAASNTVELAIVNTGVSTEAPIRVVVREFYEHRQVRVPVADISRFGRNTSAKLEQKLGGHADEHETSVMLAVAPETVQLDRASADYGHQLQSPPNVFYQPSIFDPEEASGLDFSATGARGDPSLATADKGKAAFGDMVGELATGLTALFPDLGRTK